MAVAQGQKFQQWFHRRLKPVLAVRLTRNNLYTFPHRLGGLFLLLVGVLWVLGTNYQNNLVLALAYSLVSLFVLAILHAFLNVAGLQVRWVKLSPAYAGQPIEVWLELSTTSKRGCENLSLHFLGSPPITVAVAAGAVIKVPLPAAAQARGYCPALLLCVQSHFPLGMIRCWTWLKLQADAVIYPAPKAIDEPIASGAQSHSFWRPSRGQGEDFAGLKRYHSGDSLKQVAWKHWAAGGELHSKHYVTPEGGEAWLDWAVITSRDVEVKLCGLCYWALFYHRQQRPFGLRLPGMEIPMASGEHHLHQCLTALAVFGAAPSGGARP